MKHTMTLFEDPFESTRSGKKHVEVRLNDEKRRLIQPGDIIEFHKLPERDENIKVIVTELLPFKTFEEMYNTISFEEFDCVGWTMREMIEGTYEIYTPEQEVKWGALGIRIRLTN